MASANARSFIVHAPGQPEEYLVKRHWFSLAGCHDADRIGATCRHELRANSPRRSDFATEQEPRLATRRRLGAGHRRPR